MPASFSARLATKTLDRVLRGQLFGVGTIKAGLSTVGSPTTIVGSGVALSGSMGAVSASGSINARSVSAGNTALVSGIGATYSGAFRNVAITETPLLPATPFPLLLSDVGNRTTGGGGESIAIGDLSISFNTNDQAPSFTHTSFLAQKLLEYLLSTGATPFTGASGNLYVRLYTSNSFASPLSTLNFGTGLIAAPAQGTNEVSCTLTTTATLSGTVNAGTVTHVGLANSGAEADLFRYPLASALVLAGGESLKITPGGFKVGFATFD